MTPRADLSRRLWAAEMVALSIAFASSIGLIVLAASTPVYTSSVSQQTAWGAVVDLGSSTATLIEENDTSALLIVAMPLLITITVGLSFCARDAERGPGVLAWTAVVLLAVPTLLGALTIGIWILPATTSLAIACGVRLARQHS